MFAPLLLAGLLPKPPTWLVAMEAGMPWIAVVAALYSPKRFVAFADQGSAGIPLFGVWFFSALTLMGSPAYASLVRRLPAFEMGLAAGAVLFAAAAIAMVRAKGGLVNLVVVLPLSLACGHGAVSGANCLLDQSPATVYRTVVSGKHTARGGTPYLDLEPWGPAPEAKSIMSPYSVSVPRGTYDAVRVGSRVCVVQRKGALGMAWYTARACL
jgi:hypothetical protein